MDEVIGNEKELYKIMEELQERKATALNGLSGIIMKDCRNQLIRLVCDII